MSAGTCATTQPLISIDCKKLIALFNVISYELIIIIIIIIIAVAVEAHGPLSVSSVSFLVDLGRKISERSGEPLKVVFITADQCLDSEVQFSPLSRDFPS